MASIDKKFQRLCKKIQSRGREYENKNRGVKRLQVPSHTLRHSFSNGFPAITNKKLPFKFIKGELIWFLRGDTNVKYLVDNGIPIWNKDAYNFYVKLAKQNLDERANGIYRENTDGSFSMFTFEEFVEKIKNTDPETLLNKNSYQRYVLGDVGQNYSAQWRNFNGDTDQIKNLIEEMKGDIMSSRLKVNAWNPSQLNDTALPPCHSELQIIGVPLTLKERMIISEEKYGGCKVSSCDIANKQFLDEREIPEFGFELHWNQRSVDTFLG